MTTTKKTRKQLTPAAQKAGKIYHKDRCAVKEKELCLDISRVLFYTSSVFNAKRNRDLRLLGGYGWIEIWPWRWCG
jgi:hypothetical protein